jgi:hypothetical protein
MPVDDDLAIAEPVEEPIGSRCSSEEIDRSPTHFAMANGWLADRQRVDARSESVRHELCAQAHTEDGATCEQQSPYEIDLGREKGPSGILEISDAHRPSQHEEPISGRQVGRYRRAVEDGHDAKLMTAGERSFGDSRRPFGRRVL